MAAVTPPIASLGFLQPATGYVTDLDTPLMMLSERDILTLRDFVTGFLSIGGTGSGKTSGSIAAIVRVLLRIGAGGIICCATANEAERYKRICAEEGRAHQLIVVDKTLGERFNFLTYQMAACRGSVFEAVNVLLDILNAAEGRFEGGKGDEQFWQQATRQLLAMSLSLLWAAYGRITLPELMRLIHDRPTSRAQLDPNGPWLDRSFWAQTIGLAEKGGAHPMVPEDFEPVWNYWTSDSDMLAADQKTPANIVKTLTGKLDPFLMGDLRQLFTTETTFVPEMTFDGGIILLDLSEHEWGKEGLFGQHIVKAMWQKAAQRRERTPTMRPLFCLIDECQYFLAEADKTFISTARDNRIVHILASQALSAIYAKLGQNGENTADAILGNLATKIFHALPDPRSAQWAADLIGKTEIYRRSISENESEQSGSNTSSGSSGGSGQASSNSSSGTNHGTGRGTSVSVNETMDYRLQPSHFTMLRKGGGPDRITEAVVFQSGRTFHHSGATWTPALFRQT